MTNWGWKRPVYSSRPLQDRSYMLTCVRQEEKSLLFGLNLLTSGRAANKEAVSDGWVAFVYIT